MTSLRSSDSDLEDEAAAATEETTAAAPESTEPDVQQPVVTSTPESDESTVVFNPAPRPEVPSCSGSPMKRNYTEISGRRSIHSPRPSQKTSSKPLRGVRTTRTPTKKPRTLKKTSAKKTPKALPISRRNLQLDGSSKKGPPHSVRKKKEVLTLPPRTVKRRRPLYPRRSPRIAEKRKSEEQGNSMVSPPKRKRYESEPQIEQKSCRGAERQRDMSPILDIPESSPNVRRRLGSLDKFLDTTDLQLTDSSEEVEPNGSKEMNIAVEEQIKTDLQNASKVPIKREPSTPSVKWTPDESTLKNVELDCDLQSLEGSSDEEEEQELLDGEDDEDEEDEQEEAEEDAEDEEEELQLTDSQQSEETEPSKGACILM